jgi:hypothetical protein
MALIRHRRPNPSVPSRFLFGVADVKVGRKANTILELGVGPRSGLTGYSKGTGNPYSQHIFSAWHEQWGLNTLLTLPPGAKLSDFRQEVLDAWQLNLTDPSPHHTVEDVSQPIALDLKKFPLKPRGLNPQDLRNYRGILLPFSDGFIGPETARVTRWAQQKGFLGEDPELPWALENKAMVHVLANQAGVGNFFAPWTLVERGGLEVHYPTQRPPSIQDQYVLKPTNAARGFGVMMVEGAQKIHQALATIHPPRLQQINRRGGFGDIVKTLHRQGRDERENFEVYWTYDLNNPLVLIESALHTTGVSIQDQPNDATLRIGFTAYQENGETGVLMHEGWWKGAAQAIGIGTLQEQMLSRKEIVVPVDTTTLARVQADLQPPLRQLFDYIWQRNMNELVIGLFQSSDFPHQAIGAQVLMSGLNPHPTTDYLPYKSTLINILTQWARSNQPHHQFLAVDMHNWAQRSPK